MKILIVGLGSMGKRRARLLRGIDAGFALYGVDTSAARREEAAALGVAGFETLSEALQAGEYDAGLVCTAPLSHAHIIEVLLSAGIPVFTELNLVDDGYDEILAMAGVRGLPLFLSSTMLYRGETGYIEQQVKAFAGPVNYIYHVGQYLPDWHPWENYKDFFVGNPRTGGVREILGIELPWLVETFGPVERAYIQKDSLTKLEIGYADTVFLTLRHAGGAKGFLGVDVASPKAVRSFEAFGEGLHLFWEGNPHALYKFNSETGEKQPVNTYQSVDQDARYSDNIVENAYVDELVAFLQVVAGKTQPRWSFEKDRRILRLMDAVDSAEGEVVL